MSQTLVQRIWYIIRRFWLLGFLIYYITILVGTYSGIISWMSGIFEYSIIAFLCAFGVINSLYAFSSQHIPPKRGNRIYLINELLVGAMYLVISFFLPLIFLVFTTPVIRFQLYFHLWNSLCVHLFCWQVYIWIARWRNRHHHWEISYDTWQSKIAAKHDPQNPQYNPHLNLKRKLMHFYAPALIICFYIFGTVWDQFAWWNITGEDLTLYCWVAFSIHFLWVFNIADLLRLTRFQNLGKFALNWLEGSIRPEEFHTFNSAPIMILAWIPFISISAWIPFIHSSIQVVICVSLIATLSDGLASLIGKKWGTPRPKLHNKSIVGFFTGFIVTYLIVVIIFTFIPYPTLTVGEIHLMAGITSIGFFGVDLLARRITDNFLNIAITGTILIILLAFFG